MKIIGWFGKNIKSNFGDVLNPYILYRLFNKDGFEIKHENTDLFCIGSILHPHFLDNKGNKKVIFGSGIRNKLDNLDGYDFDKYFVRGQISAKKMKCKYISDAAYLLALLKEYDDYIEIDKKYEVSYMPYIHNVDNIDWEYISEKTGVNIIYPTESIENILYKVASSKKVLSSAMHGCIIADILRVPFKRVKLVHQEGVNKKSKMQKILAKEVQNLKWQDWYSSINLRENIDNIIHIENENFNTKEKNKKVAQEIIEKFNLDENIEKGFIKSDVDIFSNILLMLRDEIEKFAKDYEIIVSKDSLRNLDYKFNEKININKVSSYKLSFKSMIIYYLDKYNLFDVKKIIKKVLPKKVVDLIRRIKNK